MDTATYISKKCGMSPIKVENNQMPLTPLFSPIYTSTRPYSQTKSNTQRALMLPDEILRMDNRECLVLLRGEKPLRLYKIIPDEHPSFGRLRDVKVSDYIPHWRQEEEQAARTAKPQRENTPPAQADSVPVQPDPAPAHADPVPAQPDPAPAQPVPGPEQTAPEPEAASHGTSGWVPQYDYGLLDPELGGFGEPDPALGQDSPYGAFDLMETPPQDVGGERNEEGQR